MANPYDIYGLTMAEDEPTAQEQAKAMADALRKQRTMATVMEFAGDPALSRVSSSLHHTADIGQKQLGEAGHYRMSERIAKPHGDLYAATARRMNEEDEAFASPEGAEVLKGISGVMLPEVKDIIANAPPKVLKNVIGIIEKYAATKLMANTNWLKALTQQGTRDDQFKFKQIKDLSSKMGTSLDPYAMRGGLRARMDIIDRAKRLQALMTDRQGNLMNLDRRQIEEVAIGLNALLAGSNVSAQRQVEALVPQSIWGNVKKLQEFISNMPTGLDQTAFLHRMLDTIIREEDVTKKTVLEALAARLPQFNQLRDLDKATYDALLQQRGIDPSWVSEAGVVTLPGQQPKLPGPKATHRFVPGQGIVPITE